MEEDTEVQEAETGAVTRGAASNSLSYIDKAAARQRRTLEAAKELKSTIPTEGDDEEVFRPFYWNLSLPGSSRARKYAAMVARDQPTYRAKCHVFLEAAIHFSERTLAVLDEIRNFTPEYVSKELTEA